MPPTKQKLVVVQGSGEFPIDMLRYDRATPCNESDSAVIVQSFRPRGRPQAARVVLWAQSVTEERWRSFGWKVIEDA